MTREEKNAHVELMNDALCEMCSSYQDCECDECEFVRPISIGGLRGVILYSIDIGGWLDTAVKARGVIMQTMIKNGQVVAVVDETGLVRIGDAATNDVGDFANSYTDFCAAEWEDSPHCRWNADYESWEEVLE